MNPLLEKTVQSSVVPALTLFPTELASLRGDMIRFARLQLRDDSLAEDAVQDAFTSALDGLDKYEERAQLKTWVFTILRNKIVDVLRDRRRFADLGNAVDEFPADVFDELFDENGCWQEDARPSDWGNPEESFSNQQFWIVFEACLNRLPEKTARVFMMREMLGFNTEEICSELVISSSNCWVVLHRARMGLRVCLNERWFQAGGAKHEL